MSDAVAELRERIAASKYDSGLDGWWAGRVENLMASLDRAQAVVDAAQAFVETPLGDGRASIDNFAKLKGLVKNAQSAHQEVKE